MRLFSVCRPFSDFFWKMPEIGVWVLQIRKGVKWQPVPSEAGRLMAGRELTADDIVSGFNRLFNRDTKTPAPDSWILFSQPTVARTATIEKTGPMEVTIRSPQEYMTAFSWLISGSGNYRIYPPDVVNKYKHKDIQTRQVLLVQI